MDEKKLQFKLAKTKADLKKVYQYNLSVFLDDEEFPWSLKWLESQYKDGYDIYRVKYEKEVVSILFVKALERGLLSMQTPLKLNFQGMGLNHQIKDHVEVLAKKAKLKDIYNYCNLENFRMTALNKAHGYEKTGKVEGKALVEWHKKI